MKKCSLCGGTCESIGNGQYLCEFCGNVFSDKDYSETKEVDKNVAQNANDGVNIFDKNVNGVLEIMCRDGNEAWCGSGYLISADGYAVTNAHVVLNSKSEYAAQCKVRVAGETVQANIIATGTKDRKYFVTPYDLAVIKLNYVPLTAVVTKFADYAKVCTGEKIFIIGNSLGDGTCITNGIVSDRLRNGLLMHDCAQNGGNSGGPAFNSKGFVIGTNVGCRLDNGARAEGMNYSIPSDKTIEFVQRCVKGISLEINS